MTEERGFLGEKAFELINEFDNIAPGSIPHFNTMLVKAVLEEMTMLARENHRDIADSLEESAGSAEQSSQFFGSVQIRHTAILRNKRCLLAYLYNRLQRIRDLRWQFGSVLPAEIRLNLSEGELMWFGNYSKLLATYMRSVGEFGGVDLTQDTRPPKALFVEVRCLSDHGELETSDGATLLLKRNSHHFLMRSDCEHLIRQGVLEHVVSDD